MGVQTVIRFATFPEVSDRIDEIVEKEAFLSKSEYLRDLIREDFQKRGFTDIRVDVKEGG